ncbi:polynucleotide adenylyltransferase PcnB [Neptunicella marina]|uniref:polynucleotide adenylyltransferase PcnB n=1 Tax=Neptunicella marina TaxID=2125989 RepID=UPI003BB079F5
MSRRDINDNALKVLYRLHNAGFEAYLVGGCVRDLLLGQTPKDFDVVTNAEPEQVKALFRNCRLIGRRFRLAHVMFGREIIEVATFRGHHQEDESLGKQSSHGQILRDNVFGTIQEDAERRDFTINAMYYNIADFSIRDFANGIKAIEQRKIALIGDPETRYREDPVRMLRAIRFAAKLDMQIDDATAKPIKTLASLLANIPPARLFEEIIKLFISGSGLKTLRLLQEYHLLDPLFPILTPLLNDPNSKENAFLEQVMRNTDQRVNSDQRVTPAFVYAALLWFPVEERCQTLMMEGGFNSYDAFNLAMGDVLDRQIQRIMIPKRFTSVIREIWQLQQRFPKRFGRRTYQILEHPRFRAAYDFLLIRAEIEGGELEILAQWWTDFQQAKPEERKQMLTALRNNESAPPKRKRRFRNKKPPRQ